MCYYLCCSHRPTIRVHTGHDVYALVITCAAAIVQPSGYILGMMCIHLLLPVLQPSPSHQGSYWGWCVYMCYYLCCSHRPTIRVHTGHDVYTFVITRPCCSHRPAIRVHTGHDVYTFVITCAAAIAQPSGYILGMMCIHVLFSVLQPSPNHQGTYWAWCVYICYYLCCSHRPTIRVHTGAWCVYICYYLCRSHRPTIRVHTRYDVYTCVITCAAAIAQLSGYILGMMCIHVLLPVLQPSPNHQGTYWGMMCIHVLLPVLQPSPNHQGSYWAWCVYMCYYLCCSHRPTIRVHTGHDVYTCVITCAAAIAQPSGFILGIRWIRVLSMRLVMMGLSPLLYSWHR